MTAKVKANARLAAAMYGAAFNLAGGIDGQIWEFRASTNRWTPEPGRAGAVRRDCLSAAEAGSKYLAGGTDCRALTRVMSVAAENSRHCRPGRGGDQNLMSCVADLRNVFRRMVGKAIYHGREYSRSRPAATLG